MNNAVKLAIYVILVLAALWFGTRFYSEFKKSNEEAASSLTETNEVSDVVSTEPAPSTNDSTSTNLTVATNAEPVTDTNVVAQAPSDTNTTTEATNESTNEAEAAPVITAGSTSVTSAKKVSKGKGMANLGAFLAVVIILGLMVAYDVTQYLGNRSVDLLFNEDLKGVHNPEYEEAEALWANGKPLDAIQAMREYLKKNPREQYVALRIAEIYEKDLHNDLAAALEYEQVLVQKLPRERWGWAAIHLCNLYSRMGKNDQCVALLRRIESEYGETAAAKKARKRLSMFESAGDETSLGVDMPEDPNMPDAAPAPATKPRVRVVAKKQEETPASNLPPGFRPKK